MLIVLVEGQNEVFIEFCIQVYFMKKLWMFFERLKTIFAITFQVVIKHLYSICQLKS